MLLLLCYECITPSIKLQIWQFPLRQTFPCGLLPPVLHTIYALPKGLLVYAVDVVFRAVQ